MFGFPFLAFLFLTLMLIFCHFFLVKYQILKILYLFLWFFSLTHLLKSHHSSIANFFQNKFNVIITDHFYDNLLNFILLSVIIIKAPYLRVVLNNWGKYWDIKRRNIFMGGDKTQKEIIKTVIELSSHKIGALITIEKNSTLEQYAQKAILINGDVSKELLLNIFTPNTPLHDGAVIVRGDKILCASAYFALSSANDNFDKKTGSRHRAALGISETTDSMTIVVSEETGNISIALEGIMIKINEKTKLQEYLAIFMN
ncbi:DNA integrity scanning protein DisA nucleotide-binding domain protein ['Fragaria x ananassa' phyllody phytoplasma]|uniref:Diadenylate cyclase n=1 Tax='Fragaria x ananassa' phyllody phytoplasma TaxID=2358428 RepID=A0ABS5K304_9MOLU|nr:DNA integrity scanning protein DisA nucleotide-binding domain protein ['Fragaria x ananassa' phyllody phytoplasma]MBS2126237.1 DNA integrity scanning protein DisA nucleotide-binding domain protein ['Fragaria x ananassa' phyllody phytoplasma]